MVITEHEVLEREILEILVARALGRRQLERRLASLYDVEIDAVRDIDHADADVPVVYEHHTLPGSFPTKLTLYVDRRLRDGPQSDDALARVFATSEGSALTALPETHPDADVPTAWMLYDAKGDTRVVHERARDDEGIDIEL